MKSGRDYPDRAYRSSREVQTYAAAQRSLGAHECGSVKTEAPGEPRQSAERALMSISAVRRERSAEGLVSQERHVV